MTIKCETTKWGILLTSLSMGHKWLGACVTDEGTLEFRTKAIARKYAKVFFSKRLRPKPVRIKVTWEVVE